MWRVLFGRYLCVWWHSTVSFTSIIKNIDFYSECWRKKWFSIFLFFHIFNCILHQNLLTPHRKLFPSIYKMPDHVSIYFLMENQSIDHLERFINSECMTWWPTWEKSVPKIWNWCKQSNWKKMYVYFKLCYVPLNI